ncbi:Binding-protein-dependent transport system inner membrane component [uncultured archaeon]|nr:Binding-protein-dependent transport system inner membrane component [uncultured archaeon]
MTKTRTLRDLAGGRGVEALSILGLIAVWQVGAVAVNDTLLLPSFFQVVAAFSLEWQTILRQDLPTSLLHFIIGMAGGLLVALPLGMGMGWFRSLDQVLDPIVEIFRPIPPLAWIPFAIVWFGLTDEAAGFIIFVGAVFPILINTYVGFRSLPRVYVESAKVLGATKDIDLVRYVAFPYALPSIAGGIRIAMGIAWMCLVAAEQFGVSTSGLGYKIWSYYYLHQMDYVLLYIVMLGLLGLVIDRTFRYIVEERLLKWQVGLTQ